MFSTSQLLFEQTPNIVRDSILQSVINNRSIADDLTATTLDSLYLKSKRLLIYAKEHYVYGLPNGSMTHFRATNDAVRTVIKYEQNKSIIVKSVVVSTPDSFMFSLGHLVDIRGYDKTTNVVHNPPQNPSNLVYLKDTQFISPSTILVTYYYTDRTGKEIEFIENINVPSVSLTDIYYHAIYSLMDGKGNPTGKDLYWFYNQAENTYPTLSIKEDAVSINEYFPIVPIRENKVNLTQNKSTELYRTSRRVLNMWGIKIDDLAKGVHSSPDINDVDHAYVINGVDVTDDSEVVSNYLYYYFGYLLNNSTYTELDYLYWLNGDRSSPPPNNTITIQDTNFRTDINYNYIKSTIKQETIGDIGTVSKTISATDRVQSNQGNYGYEVSILSIKKQITADFIEELEIHGLYHINYIYPNATVDTSLKDAFNDEDEQSNFIIPISSLAMRELNSKDQKALMYHGIRIVFNSRVTKKLKWYQTKFFTTFVKVVAIALAVFGAYQFSVAILTAASAGIVALGSVVIQAVLITVAANYAMDFLVDWLGAEWAMVIALIGSAVAMYKPTTISNIGNFQLPTSIDMLAVTQALVNGGNLAIQNQIDSMQKELSDFLAEGERLLSEFDEDKKDVDIFTLGLVTTQGRYETAEEFINRVTYNDNIGVLSLESIDTFVDRMLKLDIPENEIRTEM